MIRTFCDKCDVLLDSSNRTALSEDNSAIYGQVTVKADISFFTRNTDLCNKCFFDQLSMCLTEIKNKYKVVDDM